MKTLPNKGFILAAGRGVRFHPYSKRIPKPLFSVGGETLLCRNIRQLDQSFPLETIYVVASYKAEMLRYAISCLKDIRAYVEVVDLPKRYTSGGLLAGYSFIESFLKSEEVFVCSLADEFYGCENHASFAHWTAELDDFSACCQIKRYDYPEEYFINYAVDYDEDTSIIRMVQEKPKEVKFSYFGLGLIVAHRKLTELARDEFEKGSTKTLIDLLNLLPSKGRGAVYGFLYDDAYANINTKTDLYKALTMYRKKNWESFTIDVIIPAWNEAESIKYVVQDFRRLCNKVIVMDNQSPDGTAEIARKAGADVYSEPLSGYGDAIKKGLDRSKADILVVVEADGTFRGEDLEKLLVYLKNADAVIGTRTYWEYVEYGANMPFIQRMGNIIFGGIITLLWWNRKSRFTDVGCTFRSFWRESYEKIKSRLIAKGPEFSPELIIEFLNERQRVIEIPIPYHARALGMSKFSRSLMHTTKTALKMLHIIIYKRIYSWIENAHLLVREKTSYNIRNLKGKG